MHAHYRILAFDIRPRRLGYATFETPAKLVSFGVTRFDSLQTGVRRAKGWMDGLRPATLILRKIEPKSVRDRRRTRSLIRLIRNSAQHRSIGVSLVTDKQLRAHSRVYGLTTKHQVAAFLAGAFPELAARLPASRKPWQRENWHMPIFDATALGVTYLASKSDEAMIRKLKSESSFAGPSMA